MQWHQLDPEILQLIKQQQPPNYILIHLGSNDLVTPGLTSKKFIQEIQCSFLRNNALLSNNKLILSHILSRRYWHGDLLNSGRNIDKKRKKINKAISKFVCELGGVITHTNIIVTDPNYLDSMVLISLNQTIRHSLTIYIKPFGQSFKRGRYVCGGSKGDIQLGWWLGVSLPGRHTKR